jgi:hypothetical protein
VVLNLINSGIGTSTVAMPLAVRTLGVGLAVGALLLQAALGIIANHIISRESARSDADSYADLMQARYGKWGARAVALAQVRGSRWLNECIYPLYRGNSSAEQQWQVWFALHFVGVKVLHFQPPCRW